MIEGIFNCNAEITETVFFAFLFTKPSFMILSLSPEDTSCFTNNFRAGVFKTENDLTTTTKRYLVREKFCRGRIFLH